MRRCSHLNRQEEGQKVADAEAATSRADRAAATAAYALDKLEEGGLGARLPLEYDTREDLQEHEQWAYRGWIPRARGMVFRTLQCRFVKAMGALWASSLCSKI